MDTKKLTKQVQLKRWAEILRERTESGQTIKAWCLENEIHEKTYYYWQRKLRETVCNELSNNAPATFLEIKPIETLPGYSARSSESKNQLKVEVGSIRITADSTYPPGQLAALLRDLVRSC